MKTPKNLIDWVNFSGWTYIEIDVSLITFLCENFIRWILPDSVLFNFIIAVIIFIIF